MKLHAAPLCVALAVALAITFVSTKNPSADLDPAQPPPEPHVHDAPSSPTPANVEGSGEAQRRPSAHELALQIDVEFEGVPASPFFASVTDASGQVLHDAQLRKLTRVPLAAPGRYTVVGSGRAWKHVSSTLEVAADTEEPTVKLTAEVLNGVRGWVFPSDRARHLESFHVTVEGRLETDDGGEMRGELFSHDFTSSDGAFCVSGIQTWGHQIRLLVDAGDAGRGATEWLPFDGTHWIPDLVVDVADRASVTGSVFGRVVDAEEHTPIEHAVVRVIDARQAVADAWLFDGALQLAGEDEDGLYQVDPRTCQALSGADGSFSIESAEPRLARLLVIAPSRRPHVSEAFAIEAGGRHGPLDVALSRGATLVVRVIDADETPTPHRRQVWLSGACPRSVNHVGKDGETRFTGLDDGSYRVELRDELGDGALPIVSGRSISIAGGNDAELVLQVGGGSSGSMLEGRVEFPTESTPMTWRVFVLDADAYAGPESSAPVSSDGHFEVDDVLPGRKLVAVLGTSQDRSRQALGARSVEVAPFARVRADLDARSGAIRVVLAPGGTPSAGQSVQVVAADTQPDWAARLVDETLRPVTDRRGEIRIWGLPQGKYRFTAGSVEPQRIAVLGEPGESFDLTLD